MRKIRSSEPNGQTAFAGNRVANRPLRRNYASFIFGKQIYFCPRRERNRSVLDVRDDLCGGGQRDLANFPQIPKNPSASESVGTRHGTREFRNGDPE